MNKIAKILVRCKCGKVLHVPYQYAGKRGRCPQCASMLTVPEVDGNEFTQKTPEKICPTCGAYLNPQDELCVSCHTNLRTGEWEAITPIAKQQIIHLLPRFFFLGMMAFVAFFVLVNIKQTIGDKERKMGQFLEKNKANPDDNLQQVEQKLQRMMQKQKQMPESWRDFRMIEQQLIKQKKKLKLQEQLRQSSHQNPFVGWIKIEKLRTLYKEKHLLTMIEKHSNEYRNKIGQLLHARAGELGQLIEEKRLQEVVNRTTPQLLELLGQAILDLDKNPQLLQDWQALLVMYKESPQQERHISQKQFVYDQLQLEYYRKQFKQYEKTFKQWMYAREYDLAQEQLENIWESVHGLENIDTQKNSLVVSIRNKLREVQSVKTLFSIAHEGAKKNIGGNKTFELKNNGRHSGEIIRYALGYFIVQHQKKEIRIALKKLHAKDIVDLAIQAKNRRNTYVYAGIFYLYEREFDPALAMFQKAKQLGGNSAHIDLYVRLVNKEKEKFNNPK